MEDVPEIWKPVPLAEFRGTYEVSNLGNIRRITPKKGTTIGRTLKGNIRKRNKTEYQRRYVVLRKDNLKREIPISRIVYGAFKNHGRELPENVVVIHINEDGLDDYVNNLEAVTREMSGKKYGIRSMRRPVAKIKPNGEVIKFYPSTQAAADDNFIARSAVWGYCENKRKNPFYQGYGFRWDD